MTPADLRTAADSLGAVRGTPTHLLGAAMAAALDVPPANAGEAIAGAIRRGNAAEVAEVAGWTLDGLLWRARAVAAALREPFDARVGNGRPLPWQGDALLGWPDLGDAVVVGGVESRDVWARGIVVQAWARVVGTKPTLAELQTVQSIGRLEGFYGLATKPAGWAGSWNWGAVQCKHGAPCGDDCFEAIDSHADGSRYVWCYKRYASAVDGAADLVRLVTTARPTVRPLLARGSLLAVANEMRATHYFEAKADFYAAGLLRNAEQIAATNGEPLAVGLDRPTQGPAAATPRGALGGLVLLGGLGVWAAVKAA